MKNYFEGWYYKQQAGNRALAFIPALHTDKNGKSASLQIVTEDKAYNVAYAIDEVKLCRKAQFISIGNSSFSFEGIHLDVQADEVDLTGDLKFTAQVRPKYDIMGPFKYVPFMECRHSVFSIRQEVNGSIILNGKQYVFDSGQGYIEGDRGWSFPKRYLWSHCFHLDISIMLSVADIPFIKGSFTGIIGIVFFRDFEYRFATYLGARPISIESGAAVIHQGKYTLSIELLEGTNNQLAAPVNGGMTRLIRESISCRVHYRFSKEETVLFDFISDCASFENEYS